jgi:hypothetical protein
MCVPVEIQLALSGQSDKIRVAKHIGSAHFPDFLWPKYICGPHIELIACDCPHTHMRPHRTAFYNTVLQYSLYLIFNFHK